MVAGRRGVSGRPVQGHVGLESIVPNEIVITQCKFYILYSSFYLWKTKINDVLIT